MLYTLFKRIYADRILKDIERQFGRSHDIISMEDCTVKEWDGIDVGRGGTNMSWETFIKNFKGR